MSIKCGNFNVSKLYGPPLPVAGTDLPHLIELLLDLYGLLLSFNQHLKSFIKERPRAINEM
jgi:hypothetical protein